MKLLSYIVILIVISGCSLNKDSAYWTEDSIKKKADNIKLIKILVYQVRNILMMKSKNIVICGEKVGNFQQKNMFLKMILKIMLIKIKQI